jgi:hypothetical protein
LCNEPRQNVIKLNYTKKKNFLISSSGLTLKTKDEVMAGNKTLAPRAWKYQAA